MEPLLWAGAGTGFACCMTALGAAVVLFVKQGFHRNTQRLFLGRDDGLALLQELKLRDPQIIVIMMTAHGSIRSSVDAMKKGAFTYMTKPLDLEELNIFIQQGLNYRSLNEKVAYLSEELQDRHQYGGMIG